MKIIMSISYTHLDVYKRQPLYRRLPKRGFKNRNTKTIVGINVSALECFENDAVVTVESLMECLSLIHILLPRIW